MDTKPDPEFDALTRLACRLCNVPMAMVSLVDADRQWYKSHIGTSMTETPRDWAICAYAILSDTPLVIPDTTKDARTADSPLVTGESGIRFYAGVPLRTSDGLMLGSFCAVDTKPRDFTQRELDDLITLASQVSARLDLRRTTRRLHDQSLHTHAILRQVCESLSLIHRDANAPLTAIQGMLDLLEAEQSGEASESSIVNDLRSQLNQLTDVFADVQEYWLLQSGQLSSRPTPVCLREHIQRAANLHPEQSHASRRHIRVHCKPEQLPTHVYLDPNLLASLLARMFRFANAGESAQMTLYVECTPALTSLRRELSLNLRYFSPPDHDANTHAGKLNLAIAKQLAQTLGGELTLDRTKQPACSLRFSAVVLADEGGTIALPAVLPAKVA